MADERLLPDRFPAAAAIARANRRTRTYVPKTTARESAPEPPEGLEALVHAFDDPSVDTSLTLKEKQRFKLEVLRNRALVYSLADSGARVRLILRLTADEVGGGRLNLSGAWPVEVSGKGHGRHGRIVTLRFTPHPIGDARVSEG